MQLPKDSNILEKLIASSNHSIPQINCAVISLAPDGIYIDSPINVKWPRLDGASTQWLADYQLNMQVFVEGLDPGKYLLQWHIFCYVSDTADTWERYRMQEKYLTTFTVPLS
ncbi:MAG: hypothetical protein LBJ95_01320 [Oscillospiraceae bacterium]|nr:hypothetical protein [Oscillospiraceae bacterium]